MKSIISIFLSLLTFHAIALEKQGVETNARVLENDIASGIDTIFPEKCLGVWEGRMYIYSQGVLRDSVQVRFTAAKTDTIGTYTWKTAYLSATRPMVKDYKLEVVDAEKGRFMLDEGDGVNIVMYAVNNKLYSLNLQY